MNTFANIFDFDGRFEAEGREYAFAYDGYDYEADSIKLGKT